MIDLTPLDVRKKKGDFKKGLRGYDTEEVDVFMDLVAERLEALVKENLALKDRVEKLQVQVEGQEGRERAVHEALVTAQELREQMKAQAKKEAELIRREAEAGARDIMADAERRIEWLKSSFKELERKRGRFLRSFRSFLERELDVVAVEEEREPLSELGVDLGPTEHPDDEAPFAGDAPFADEDDSVEEAFGRIVDTAGDAETLAADAGSGSHGDADAGGVGAYAAGAAVPDAPRRGDEADDDGSEADLLLSLDESERSSGEPR